MFLRKVIEHVKNENWFAIFIDFIIVVAGIFIGFQLTNWKTSNEEKALYQQQITISLHQLAQDKTIINHYSTIYADEFIPVTNTFYENIQSCHFERNVTDKALMILTSYQAHSQLGLNVEPLLNFKQQISQELLLNLTLYQKKIKAGLTNLKENAEIFYNVNIPFSNYAIAKSNKDGKVMFSLSSPFERLCKDAQFSSKVRSSMWLYEINLATQLALAKETQSLIEALNSELKRVH